MEITSGDVRDASSVKGFLLTRQWQEQDDRQHLVFWLITETGPVCVRLEDEPSIFFLPSSMKRRADSILRDSVPYRTAPVQLKNFEQDDVIACYFATQKQLNIARSRFLQEGLVPLEADLRPTDRYLMERFITGAVELEGESQQQEGYRLFVNPRLKSTEYHPSLRVVSLDIETSWTDDILFSIAVYTSDQRHVFMVGDRDEADLDYVQFLADESSVIRAFLDWCSAYDPDLIIGWSVVAFDLHFLQRRCDALKISFDLGRAGEAVKWRTTSRGQARNYALVPGRVVLDGIEMLRTATYSFESFSLEYVSRRVLGRGKLVTDVDARAAEIQRMFYEDKARLAEYNLDDCVLVWEIFAATNLIEFAVERSRLTGLDLDRAGGSVAAFDFLYLPRLHRRGYVAPVVLTEPDVGSPGGYVLDSKPGLYDHVIVLDFKSLYPSIIRTFHVDPLAMILARDEKDAVPGFNGASFSRETFILPSIIEALWAARDDAKRLGQKAMSQAIKIIMNSFYGVLGTPGCRFFDLRLVSSITLRGHEILQQTRDLIESRGYDVIYGDTDSVFVLLAGMSDPAEVDETGKDLTLYLNTWWRDHLKSRYDIASCLEVEYETHFDRFLMPTVRGSDKGSKKRYAGLMTENGKQTLVYKGLETVRSDWSQLAREFQQALYERIFHDQPFEAFIKETVAAVREGRSDDKLLLRRRLRRHLDEYTKNVPPHVRAARRAEEIREARGLAPLYDQGGWIEYVMTLGGPEPRAYVESPIDYQFYIDRQLAPIADAILNFKSTSLAAIIDRQLDLF